MSITDDNSWIPVFENPVAAALALHDPNPITRADALFELLFRWGMREQYREVCVQMAFDDVDANVRARAIAHMTGLFEKTSDKIICGRLARIATDESQDRESRLIAYISLVEIAGLSVWEKVKSVHEFQFPQDVDRNLISRFLD